MPAQANEVERRKKVALTAIRVAFGTGEDEGSATLFDSHHSRVTLSRVLNGHASVSADMALRLEAALGTSAGMWIGM